MSLEMFFVKVLLKKKILARNVKINDNPNYEKYQKKKKKKNTKI
jgi:hypothetical protein